MSEKYCGMIYKSEESEREIANGKVEYYHDDAYGALCCANNKWNSMPDPEDGRLLIVAKSAATSSGKNIAFFQFKSDKSCKDFINARENIKWSNFESICWNGDGNFMTN